MLYSCDVTDHAAPLLFGAFEKFPKTPILSKRGSKYF